VIADNLPRRDGGPRWFAVLVQLAARYLPAPEIALWTTCGRDRLASPVAA